MILRILFGDSIDIEDLPQNDIVEDNKVSENTVSNNKVVNKNNSSPYYIKVNYGAQVVTIYSKDGNGDYSVPVKAMVCSTGVYTPTSGVYKIPARWEWLHLQGDVWGHYSTQIKGNILFHSVPYLRKGELDSLEYWEYDKLGTYASAGCVRLTVEDAKWIFDNCKNGTQVEFFSSSNAGPLGKPSAKKISSYDEHLRNWDPTDPHPNNPWKNYKGPTPTTSPATNNVGNEVISNTVDNTISSNTVNNTVSNEVVSNNTTNNEVVSNSTNAIVSNTTNNIISNETSSNVTNDIVNKVD